MRSVHLLVPRFETVDFRDYTSLSFDRICWIWDGCDLNTILDSCDRLVFVDLEVFGVRG